MKKKISLYLALILFFNMCLPSVNPVPVYAAPSAPEFTADFTQVLEPQDNDYAPALDRTSTTDSVNNSMLQWSLDGMPIGSSYTLSWHTQDNDSTGAIARAELVIRKITDVSYMADFNLFRSDGTRFADSNGGFAFSTNSATDIRYFVQNQEGASVRIDDFFDSVTFPQGAGAVINNNPGNPTAANYLPSSNNENFLPGSPELNALDFRTLAPSFKFTENSGFSFRYYGYDMSFLYENGNFYTYVGNLRAGYIYDFELTHELTGGASSSSIQSIFTGLDFAQNSTQTTPSGFVAIPIAQKGSDKPRSVWNEELSKEPDFWGGARDTEPHPESVFETSVIDMYKPPSERDEPAMDENGLSLRFNMPKRINTAGTAFDFVNDPSNANAPGFDGKIDITFTIGTHRIQVLDITNIDETNNMAHVGSPLPTNIEMLNVSRLKAFDKTKSITDAAQANGPQGDTNRIEVQFIGLDSTTRYETGVEYGRNNSVVCPVGPTDPTLDAGYRHIFTLPELEIMPIGDRYYLAIKRYALGSGYSANSMQYELKADDNANLEYYYASKLMPFIIQPGDVDSNPEDWMLFPLEIPMANPVGNGNIYQVLATLGQFDDIGNSEDGRYFYSQVIQYHPESSLSYISPGDVSIIDAVDYDHRNKDYVRETVDKTTKMYPPAEDPSGDTAYLEYWMHWDVVEHNAIMAMLEKAEEDLFNNGNKSLQEAHDEAFVEIIYEINKGDAPNGASSKPLTAVKLIIEYEKSAIYDSTSTTSGGGLWVSYYGVDADGNESNEYVVNENPNWFEAAHRDSNDNSIYAAEVHFKFTPEEVKRMYNYNPQPIFLYPNVYFLNVRPISLEYGSDPPRVNDSVQYPASRFVSITLNDFTKTLPPPPQDFSARAVPVTAGAGDEDNFNINVSYRVPYESLKAFFDDQWKAATFIDEDGESFDYRDVSIDLYIGTYEDAARENFSQLDPETGTRVLDQRNEIFGDLVSTVDSDSTFLFSELSTTSPAGMNFSKDGEKALARIRVPERDNATGLIRISQIPIFDGQERIPFNAQDDIDDLIEGVTTAPVTNLLLTNLDQNQSYYLIADLVASKYADKNHTVPLDINNTVYQEASLLTGLEAVTLSSVVDGPDNTDKAPAAPEVVVVDEQQTRATIGWNRIAADGSTVNDGGDITSNSIIEYEIVRLQGQPMPDNDTGFRSMEVNLNEFLSGLGASPQPKSWLVGSEAFDNASEAYDPDVEVSDAEDPPIQFTDKTLSPNVIYYYYVRAKKTVTVYPGNGEDSYEVPLVSSWNYVSVTTSPVDAPINLKVEYGDEFDYDRMTEIVVSWDSAMENINLLEDEDLVFRYQLKREEDDWEGPTDVPVEDIESSNTATEGIMHFIFDRLTGLEANTTYQMRVQLYDTVKKDGSVYSNIETFVTDFDQKAYEQEREREKWMDYLRDLLEELLTGPYWVTRDTEGELTVMVRPGEMFNNLLYSSSGGSSAIELYNNGQDSVTYYIPASVIIAANNSNRGFRLPYDDMDILLSPSAFNENYNDALMRMLDEKHADEISDYFVRMTVERSDLDEEIENMPALSKQAEIGFEAVGTVLTYDNVHNAEVNFRDIETWDKAVFDRAALLLMDELENEDLADDIMDEIEDERLTEEMMAFIESKVEGIRDELLDDIDDQLSVGRDGILSDVSEQVTNLNAPMYVVSKSIQENTYVSGYKDENDMWVPYPTAQHDRGQAITTQTPGTYVLTGRTVDIPGIEEVARGGSISAFTALYGLEDYLGYGGVDLEQNATRKMVAGCVARIAGAPKDADPMVWIDSNLNVRMSSRNSGGLVQTQEAAAMVMALYEDKTNTPIESMTIRNYQVTANMAGLDDRYAQAVRAAFETGILTDTAVNPSGPVTIRTLLDMLGALNGKVKL